MKFEREREETASIMRRLYDRGLTTCSGGNVSMRLGDGLFAVTPSSSDKAYVQAADIAVIDPDGNVLDGSSKTSIETGMHLAVYRARPDIGAVVHAHPLHATFYTATEQHLRTDIIAEARFLLGEPVTAPYGLMGTEELARSVGLAFSGEETRVVLMENHGVITAADTLFRAFDRMEVLEEAARMSYMAQMTGGVKGISAARLKEIDQLS